MTSKELESYRVKYEIPDFVEMIVPDPSHAAYNPPPGYMCVYEISIHCGWRLPVAQAFLDILNVLELAPN